MVPPGRCPLAVPMAGSEGEYAAGLGCCCSLLCWVYVPVYHGTAGGHSIASSGNRKGLLLDSAGVGFFLVALFFALGMRSRKRNGYLYSYGYGRCGHDATVVAEAKYSTWCSVQVHHACMVLAISPLDTIISYSE